jgi:hypothetical protein
LSKAVVPLRVCNGSACLAECRIEQADAQHLRRALIVALAVGINDGPRIEEHRAHRDKPEGLLRRRRQILNTFRLSASQGGRSTFGNLVSGWPRGRGSASNTSKPAP